MIALTLDDVDGFVTKLQHKGIDVRWDGWTMVFFEADDGMRSSKHGVFRNDTFGRERRVSPNQQGKWLVDKRLAQRSARGR